MAMRSCSVIASLFATASLREPTLVTVRHALCIVVQADAAEVDRQIRLQAADHDLEDAAQIVTLADRAGDPVQQVQAAQLELQLRLGGCAFLHRARERVDHPVECDGDIGHLSGPSGAA